MPAALNMQTKAILMRKAFGKLTGEYVSDGNHQVATRVQKAAEQLDGHPESLVKLYDIIIEASK